MSPNFFALFTVAGDITVILLGAWAALEAVYWLGVLWRVMARRGVRQ